MPSARSTTEPKILPCLHYYCKKCILKLAPRTGSNQSFSCPECWEETTLPEGGVDQLKTAFFVNRFKSNFSVLQRVHGKVEVMCEECTESEARRMPSVVNVLYSSAGNVRVNTRE